MQRSMTIGKPYWGIIRFAIPLLIGNLFQQCYNMADAFIISRTLGVDAFAGVSCTSGLANLIIGFASGMTAGLAIPLAQAFGAGDQMQVKRHYRHNLILSVVVGLALTLFGVWAAPLLLRFLRTPTEIFAYAQEYLRVLFAGITATILYNFFANTLRALGDSRSPLRYLLIASGINIVLDYVLISYTPLGVKGAALATIISQFVSVLLCAVQIFRSVEILSLRGYPLQWESRLARSNLAMGLPMAFQSSIISLGVILMQFATNGMGTAAIAAYSAAQKIDGVAVEPLRSLGLTMSTYAGQNYGAKEYGRIRTGVKQCCTMAIGLSLVLGVVMYGGGRLLASIFVGNEPEILDMAHQFLRVHGTLYSILAVLFCYRYTLQGLDSAMIPTIAGIMELVMRTFTAFLLVPRLEFFGASIGTPLYRFGTLLPVAVARLRTDPKLRAAAEEEGKKQSKKGSCYPRAARAAKQHNWKLFLTRWEQLKICHWIDEDLTLYSKRWRPIVKMQGDAATYQCVGEDGE